MSKSIYILLVLILVSLLLIFWTASQGGPTKAYELRAGSLQSSSAGGRGTSDTLLISDIHDGGVNNKGWGRSEDDTGGCAGGSVAALESVVKDFAAQGGKYIIFGGDSLTHDSQEGDAMIQSAEQHLEIFSQYVDLANVLYANGNHDGAMNGKAFFGCKGEPDSKRWADLLIRKGVVSNLVGGNTDIFRKTGYYMKNIPSGSQTYLANFNSVLLRAPSWDAGHALTTDCEYAKHWRDAVDSPNAPDMIDRLYSDLQSLPAGSEVYIVTHYPYFGRGDGTGHSTDRGPCTKHHPCVGGPTEFFALTNRNGKPLGDFSNKIKGFLTAHTHKRLVVGEKDGKQWLNMPAFHPNNWGCCAKNSDCGTIDDASACLAKKATDYCTCEDEAAQPAFAYANIKDIFQPKDMYLKC